MKTKIEYFRDTVFGSEDGLVSSVGALFGLATSGVYMENQIILAGLVIISVEAISMGAGAFLTAESIHDIESGHRDNPLLGGVIMFFSYALSGLLVLSPYFFLPVFSAKYVSVIITMIALYFLGFLPKRNVKSGLRMFFVAGIAILTGFLVGKLFGSFNV
jgi:VIT1/CCC1 family predicted Fe2+/Mn2+ transporter